MHGLQEPLGTREAGRILRAEQGGGGGGGNADGAVQGGVDEGEEGGNRNGKAVSSEDPAPQPSGSRT